MNLNKVAKGLSQEEMTLVNNISSLIGELKSASGVANAEPSRSGQPPIEDPSQISQKAEPSPSDKMVDKAGEPSPSPSPSPSVMQKAEPSPSDPSPSPSKSVKKDQTNTESDGATANDDAEERMLDALSEVNVENVDEVKKAVSMIRDLQEVRAMKSRSITPLASAMVELTNVVKSVINDQHSTQMALKNILDGMGVTQQMSLVQKTEQVATPIMTNDNEAMAKVIKGLLSAVAKDQGTPETFNIGKNTGIALNNVEKALGSMVGMIPKR